MAPDSSMPADNVPVEPGYADSPDMKTMRWYAEDSEGNTTSRVPSLEEEAVFWREQIQKAPELEREERKTDAYVDRYFPVDGLRLSITIKMLEEFSARLKTFPEGRAMAEVVDEFADHLGNIRPVVVNPPVY